MLAPRMDRAYSLDGLRAIAVLIVMISHAGLGSIVPGGFGVTIFFFLSGYLITSLMVVEFERSSKIDFRAFYFRRAVRILPPMWIAIVATLGLSLVWPFTPPIEKPNLAWDLLFLTNYVQFDGLGSNIPIPLWSLDIEEHYYLAFPAIFAILYRRFGSRGVAVFCAGLCVLVLGVRLMMAGGPNSFDVIYYSTHARIDSILFGCILATFNSPEGAGKQVIGSEPLPFLAGLAMIVLSLAVRNPTFQETFRYTLQGCGLFLIFNFVLRTNGFVAQVLSHRAFRPVADYSYFLYLIHLPLLRIAESHSGLPRPATYAVGLASAFVAAWLVHRFVEKPLAIWRKSVSRSQVLRGQPQPKGLE